MFFNGILDGTRTSDIRCTLDRRFKVKDHIIYKEWDPIKNEYTGRKTIAEITYIQTNKSNPCAISHQALADEYAVLSIKVFGSTEY